MLATNMESNSSPGRERRKRCRSGCWTCRDAGYKCDEARPFCGRCVRLGRQCQGYEMRLIWRHHGERRKKVKYQPQQRRDLFVTERTVKDSAAIPRAASPDLGDGHASLLDLTIPEPSDPEGRSMTADGSTTVFSASPPEGSSVATDVSTSGSIMFSASPLCSSMTTDISTHDG